MEANDEIKEYTNGEVTVLWQASKCKHAAKCVGSLPSVFRPREKPWICMNGAASEEIVSAVRKCPSGALTMKGEL